MTYFVESYNERTDTWTGIDTDGKSDLIDLCPSGIREDIYARLSEITNDVQSMYIEMAHDLVGRYIACGGVTPYQCSEICFIPITPDCGGHFLSHLNH